MRNAEILRLFDKIQERIVECETKLVELRDLSKGLQAELKQQSLSEAKNGKIVEGHSKRLDRFAEQIGLNIRRISDHESTINEHDEYMTNTTRQIEAQKETIDEQSNLINQLTEKIIDYAQIHDEQNVYTQEQYIRIDNISKHVEDHARRLDEQKGWIDSHMNYINEHSVRMDGINELLSQYKHFRQTVNQKEFNDDISKWINQLSMRMDNISKQADGHAHRLDEQHGWIDSHMNYINEHSRRMDSINELLSNYQKTMLSLAKEFYIFKEGSNSIYIKYNTPRIIQLVPNFVYGDAIGQEVFAVNKMLQRKGYQSDIFTHYIDEKYPTGTGKLFHLLPNLHKDDIVIYRYCSGSKMADAFVNLKCKKVLAFHNITPPEYFEGYDEITKQVCDYGMSQFTLFKNRIDCCITVSEFNRRCLLEQGYDCDIAVIPKYIQYEDYEKAFDTDIIDKYADKTKKNILFVGRIVPNKKFDDIIRAFHAYKRDYNTEARLFLVGSCSNKSSYLDMLNGLIAELGVEDVIITGHIKFNELLSYYRLADLFLCMSEHEGFCVPLVEAMYFGVPIIAYDGENSAVGETLGDAGVLVKTKSPKSIAREMNAVLTDKKRINEIKLRQKERLEYFSQERVETMYMECLDKLL